MLGGIPVGSPPPPPTDRFYQLTPLGLPLPWGHEKHYIFRVSSVKLRDLHL